MLLCSFSQCLLGSGCQRCTWDFNSNKGICFLSLRGWKNCNNIFSWKACFFHCEKKKKKSVFFLLVIFSTSQAEPRGVSKERPGTSLPLRARRPSGHTGPLVPQRDGKEDSSCPRAQSQRPNARSCSRDPKEGGYT